MPLSVYNSQGVSYYTNSIPSIWNFSKISNRERLTNALTPSIRDPPWPGGSWQPAAVRTPLGRGAHFMLPF